jgi:lysophospholipase L1-like esterase
LNIVAIAGRVARFSVVCVCLPLGTGFAGFAAAQTTDFETAMQAFARQDAKYPPPADALVVTGSSTIRLWSGIRNDFAPLEVIPRGFGSSTADDLDYYLDRVVLAYAPRAVAIYEGDHDLQVGMAPEFILERLTSVVQRIGTALPEARLYLISVKPSPKYFSLWPQAVDLNQRIAALCMQTPRCTYLDAASSLLLSNGKVDKTLFRSDHVHLNSAGYAIWNGVLRPALMAGEGASIHLPDFRYQDVGSVSLAGSATASGGFISLLASGPGIAETGDGFHFAWRQLTGSGQVTARISARADGSGDPFAGVMLREQLTPNARFALANVAPLSGASLSYRAAVGGPLSTGAKSQPDAGAPYWVKLVRKSATVYCYSSATGTSWQGCGKAVLSGLKKTVYVGLAASSAVDGQSTTATFDNVYVVGSTSLPAPVPAGDIAAPSVPQSVVAQDKGSGRIEVTWAPATDPGTGVAGYDVFRDGSPVPIATTTATHFEDAGLAPNTAYSYTVTAFDGAVPANHSNPSLSVGATTASLP